MNANNPFLVRTLTCKRDLEMAIVAYKSFINYSRQPIKLLVHTDGSCSESDIEKLLNALPEVQIIDKKETDVKINEVLSKYPNCRAYRESQPLANKLFDIPLSEASCLRFIDCDILFLKPFDNLFSYDEESRFCLEDDCGYSGRLSDLVKVSKKFLPIGCNTGILQMSNKEFDLDYIEWFLSQNYLLTFPSMAEQTLYAILLGNINSRTYSSSQIFTSRYSVKVTSKTIAVHFMYSLKSQFFKYASNVSDDVDVTPTQIQLFKAKRVLYPYIVKRALLRKIK